MPPSALDDDGSDAILLLMTVITEEGDASAGGGAAGEAARLERALDFFLREEGAGAGLPGDESAVRVVRA